MQNTNNQEINWEHFVSKEKSIEMVTRFKEVRTALIEGEQKFESSLMAQAERLDYSKSMMSNMMNKDECTGIRVYYAINDDERIVPLLCGVDADGNDIYWTKEDGEQAEQRNFEEGLMDMSTKEPPTGGITILP